MNATKLQALRKKLSKYEFEKVYLDELPEFETVIRDWLDTLVINSDLNQHDIERIDCRSRSGFIANSWNHGGLDLVWSTDVKYCLGSGYHMGIKAIADAADYNLELANKQIKKEGLDRDNPKDLDRCYDIEDAYNEDTVWFGIRCMYEGVERGIHTLMVYTGVNVCDYYGPHGKGSDTLGTYTIRFRTASGLRRQLEHITKKVEGCF